MTTRESFKSLFYLFSGKPDSKLKILNRPVTIELKDLIELNDQVVDKLKLHNIEASISNCTLKLGKSNFLEFGSWLEFQSYNFKIQDQTKEIIIHWDFLVTLNDFKVPQRHTLTVRLSLSPNPKEVFQLMISDDNNDESFESRFGLCIARVNFISHRLADELLDVVEKWNVCLDNPFLPVQWFLKMKDHKKNIARIVHHSTHTTAVLFLLFSINLFFTNMNETATTREIAMATQILFGSIMLSKLSSTISNFLANKTYFSIDEYGSFSPFNITNGDEKHLKKIKINNNYKIRIFLFNALFAFFLNAAAGIAVCYIWSKYLGQN